MSSFVSVSLRPSLVAFCAGRTSQSWAAIDRTGLFCVSLVTGLVERRAVDAAARRPLVFY